MDNWIGKYYDKIMRNIEAKRIEKDMCKVCYKNKKNTAYIHCGHFNQIEISLSFRDLG
jgi:hypothetical protein